MRRRPGRKRIDMQPTLSRNARVTVRVAPDFFHRLILMLAWAAMLAFIVWAAVSGFSYYRLGLAERVYSPARAEFRPSGSLGLKLGIGGLMLFLCLFIYPIRKRSKWLSSIGKTKHWLDFHVLFGISAPLLITLHSSFKFRGLAGVAYWIMIAVALSGFIGRYIYSQVPRSLNATEMTLAEMQSVSAELARKLEQESVVSWRDLEPLLALPPADQVNRLPVFGALLWMLRLDIARPFHVSRLRRRALGSHGRLRTLGGFLSSHDPRIEVVIAAARKQSWLSSKMLFLRRVQEMFHLWHVVHRPFSYSFAALAVIHIMLAVSLGYY
jgi:TRAP-type C4-dicarboxylate transport system permease small subunit